MANLFGYDHAAEVVYTADYSGCLHVISPFSVCICNAGWRQLTRADTALPDESVRTSTEKRGDAAASHSYTRKKRREDAASGVCSCQLTVLVFADYGRICGRGF